MPGNRRRITFYDHAYETFAVQYLAATLREKGYPVEVCFDSSMDKDTLAQAFPLRSFFSLSPEKVARKILETDPDIVGFSIMTCFYPALSRIMAHLKKLKPGVLILAGGPHCMFSPETVFEDHSIDFVFKGDADFSLPRFLEELEHRSLAEIRALPAGAMPGVSNLMDGKVVDRGLGPCLEDLDAAPYPEKEAYYGRNPAFRRVYTTTTSRGCLYRCTYCNSSNLKKLYESNGMSFYRCRSVENVMRELRMVKERYQPSYIMFLDNVFAPNKEWLRSFVTAYKEQIGLPFYCETNPNVHNKESLDLLAESGCVLLQFGFQTANERIRKDILHRYEKNDHIRELVGRAKERGMFVCVDHIVNLPGEREEHLHEALRFYQEIKPGWVNLAFLQYYPQAEIIDIARSHGILKAEDVGRIARGEFQSDIRVTVGSNLAAYYRVFPMQLFAAFKLPAPLFRATMSVTGVDLLARLLAPLASAFIYATRILYAFFDRRDFLIRQHVERNLHAAKNVFIEKAFGRAG